MKHGTKKQSKKIMGNNQSNTITTPNPCWRSYQIQRVERGSYSIKFFLDNIVKYYDKFDNIINCVNILPYCDIHAGDRIEVNWYMTEDYSSSHEFTDDDNLRIIRFQKALPNYDLVQNYYLNGVFIVERKTERHGNIEVEYIKKVRLLDSEVISNIEVIRARPI